MQLDQNRNKQRKSIEDSLFYWAQILIYILAGVTEAPFIGDIILCNIQQIITYRKNYLVLWFMKEWIIIWNLSSAKGIRDEASHGIKRT